MLACRAGSLAVLLAGVVVVMRSPTCSVRRTVSVRHWPLLSVACARRLVFVCLPRRRIDSCSRSVGCLEPRHFRRARNVVCRPTIRCNTTSRWQPEKTVVCVVRRRTLAPTADTSTAGVGAGPWLPEVPLLGFVVGMGVGVQGGVVVVL